jgi:uncharacterized protein YukE
MSLFEEKVKPESLRNAAKQSDEAESGTGVTISQLDAAHAGVPGQTVGFSFAEELLQVQCSWESRLRAVKEKCGSVSEMLRQTADNYEKNEAETADSFKATKTGSGDTSAVKTTSASVSVNPFG